MIDRKLLDLCTNQEGLLDLIRSLDGGLAWPIKREFALYYEPEISRDVRPAGHVRVHSLVPASADNPWLILLAEFEEKKYVRRDLRGLLSSVRSQIRQEHRFEGTSGYDDTIFIAVTPGYEDVNFVRFVEQEGRQPRIRSFGWSKAFIGRTVLTHNLERLRWNDRDEWEKAWDVEGLTDKFYAEFMKVFGAVKAATWHPAGDEMRQAYAQHLLDRLLFISFIERMGWLETPDGNTDYLHAQWLRFKNRENYADITDKSFIPATFNGLLGWLFFSALDNPSGIGPSDPLYPIVGKVPYLNGGLFTEDADLDVSGVTVADEVFDLLLGDSRPGFDGGLFRRFNFTVTESTPLDQEVAVDPEMLGTIFERLVTGRHETGAYYTPRQVVSFMVKQALRGHLENAGLPPEKAEQLVERHDVSLLTHPESKLALESLRAIRALDPACGSGAYLMGLHQEIFDIIDALVLPFEGRDPSVLYHRKLRLLQDTIFGVDIDATAVRIARLRLWLSLVVENHGVRPEPLPHLDFKIEQGDSLTFPVYQSQAQGTSVDNLLEEFTQAKLDSDDPDYDGSRGSQQERREVALQHREAIRSYNSAYGKDAFNWRGEFFEVLGKGKQGFGIVLANPPYVRADAQFKHLLPNKNAQQEAIAKWKSYRTRLKNSGFYETLHEKWDLFIPFLERAHLLLCGSGQMVFIIPDAYNANKYASKSHALFLSESEVERIDFCSEIPLFKAAVFNTIVHFSKKTPDADHTPIRARRWGDSPNDFEPNCEMLETGIQNEANERVFRPISERNPAAADDTIPLAMLCYISVGAVLHADEKTAHEAFKLDDLISTTQDAAHPKKLFLGKNMGSWTVVSNVWLEYGTERAPAQFRRPTFPELYEVPEKLVTMDLSGPTLRVVYDDLQCWHNHSAWSIVLWQYLRGVRNNSIRKTARYRNEPPGSCALATPREDLETLAQAVDIRYLQGLMNSTFAHNWIGRERRNKMHVYPDDWKKFPIKALSKEGQQPIASIVGSILSVKRADPNADVSDLESRLNNHVDFLYYHKQGAETYDEWLAKREAEKGTVIEEVRKLIAVGHETLTHEYKSSFAWDIRKNERGDYLKDEVHAAICAFLNAGGGELLIGVDDDGNILGLVNDLTRYGSKDKFVQAVESVFGSTLLPNPIGLVRISFVEIDGKTICRVRVQGDNTTIYKFKDSIFARRNSGSKPALTAEDAARWWPRRQRGEE